MATERELSPQQDLFCQQYIIDYNGYQSAIRAKYSKKTAYVKASQLLSKVKIQERIEQYKKQHLLNADITIEQILNELKIMGFSNLPDVFKSNKGYVTLDELKKLPPQVTRAIKSFEMGKDGIKLKFHAKEKSLELLGRYRSMFTDKLQINGDIKTDNELVIKVVQVNGAGPPPKKGKEKKYE